MGDRVDMMGLAELLAVSECHATDGKPWHMLRHTFAAHAVMSGASLHSVQRLMGHSDAKMTQRYAHLAPDFLAAEVARMRFAPAPEQA
jgi:site-specific recombinase XerD